MRPALTVIVPAYEEAAHVRENLLAIATAVEALGRPFELLLVDDGSRDATAAEAEAAARVYHAVTAMLFRLPIRDTQTGLKILRRDVARAIVPAIRTRRYAWDIELLVLAHRAGARIVSGPVNVDFGRRGVRIGPAGFLAS